MIKMGAKDLRTRLAVVVEVIAVRAVGTGFEALGCEDLLRKCCLG